MTLRQVVLRYPTMRHMLVSGIGSFLAPLINVASIVVIIQLYGPDDYGLWAVLTSVSLLPGTVATLRYELAIVLAEEEEQAGRAFLLCLLLSAVFALATWAVVGSALLAIPAWQYREGLLAWLWAVPLLVFLTGFVATGTAWCTRQQAFGVQAVALVMLAALVCGVQIGAYFVGMRGAGGLILGSVVGNSACALILLAFVLRRPPLGFLAGFTLRGMRALVVRYRNFPLFSVPYTFVGALRLQGVTLLFGSLAAANAVGHYAFAYRLANFPVGPFTNGIRPVLFEKAARLADLRNLQAFVENLLQVLSTLCLPVLVLFLARADHLFSALLPARWMGAAPYVKLLVLPAVAFLHTNWMDRILDVLQLQKLAFKLEACFSLACLTGLGFGLLVLDSPLLAVALQATCLLTYNVYYVHVIYRETGFERSGLWRYGCRTAVQAAGCAALFCAADTLLPLYASDVAFLLIAYGVGAIFLGRHFAQHLRPSPGLSDATLASANPPKPARLSA